MDIPYDHIQEESFSPTDEKKPAIPPQQDTSVSTSATDTKRPSDTSTTGNAAQTVQPPTSPSLHSAISSISTSQWGSTLNSWFSTARKQGETFYQDLQKEATEASEQATKGFSSLREQVVSRTRSLSLNAEPGPQSAVPGEEGLPEVVRTRSSTSGAEDAAAAEAAALQSEQGDGRAENLPADIVKEAGTLVASLRSTAASKLKDLQKAEDAADEALLKFGTNVRNFLRDAVVITAPPDQQAKEGETEVLFETQEPGTGKKVFHSTRLDAQLHAIHTTASSFTEDPASEGAWEGWKGEFDIDKKTEDIAQDLDRFEELRRAMEKLVPEKVEYKVFWMRYYFLRKAVEEEERRRREVLKGAANVPEEEVAWDEDSDDEGASSTPHNNKAASESTTTLNAPAANSNLKPNSPRRSHEDENKSVADSDASYDMVSGATSRATGSPKEEKSGVAKDDTSDDDWE